MINILSFIFIVLLLTSCSFNDVGGFWSKKKTLEESDLQFKVLFKDKKIVAGEFNKNFQFILDKSTFKINKNSRLDNNDGAVFFQGNLSKIQKYNFSKIKNFFTLEPNLILNRENIIFFDNKGSILNFDKDSKLIWKTNKYSKAEIKTGPLLSLAKYENKLIVSDNISKCISYSN